LARILRTGRAGSNTTADHIIVLDAALAQIPDEHRYGVPLLVRADPPGTAPVPDALSGLDETDATPSRSWREAREPTWLPGNPLAAIAGLLTLAVVPPGGAPAPVTRWN
jgi:hypothetical protein